MTPDQCYCEYYWPCEVCRRLRRRDVIPYQIHKKEVEKWQVIYLGPSPVNPEFEKYYEQIRKDINDSVTSFFSKYSRGDWL